MLNVTAESTKTIYYQWRKGTTTVGSGPTLTLTDLEAADAGEYYAVAFTLSPTCSSNSESAMLRVAESADWRPSR